jgi:RNA polymerase sigma-70 factor, ECF subfamily
MRGERPAAPRRPRFAAARGERLMDSSLGVTDEDLAVRSRDDAEAYGQLYERYVDRVHAFVMSRLRDRSAAEDVTAEVFLKALRAIDRYQPIYPFRAWLFQIATNAVIDHVRRRRPSVALDVIADLPTTGPAVDDHALARAELAEVTAAMADLSERQRTALSLRLGQGMNNAEIAATMGRSEGAVKVLIHRGLQVVRQRLRPSVPAPGDVI